MWTRSWQNPAREYHARIEAEEDEARDALFPPGHILYLNRVAPATDSSQANSPSSPLASEEEVELVKVGNVLSNKMIVDHRVRSPVVPKAQSTERGVKRIVS